MNNVNEIRNTTVLPPMPADKRERYERVWQQFGWEERLPFDQMMETCPDFLQFLISSRLLFTIRGYQRGDNMRLRGVDAGLKVDQDGRPHIFKEGVWVPWETLKNQVEFSRIRNRVVSKNDPNTEWIYVYPNGLVPEQAANYSEPVFSLKPNELARLKQHCGTTEEKTHILQIYTNESGPLKTIGHVALRLIDEEGNVRSFSFRTPPDDGDADGSGIASILATYNAEISTPDFTEFHPFERRRVTTLAISQEHFDRALQKVRNYNDIPFRFNFIHQNCVTFTTEVLRDIGIPINAKCSAGGFLWDVLKGLPVLGLAVTVIDKIGRAIIWTLSCIPSCITKPICFIISVVFYIPNKCLTVCRNIFLFLLGGARIASPPRPGVENNWDNSNGLTSFDRLMDNWTDLFKEEVGYVDSSIEVVRWQLAQPTTFIHDYTGLPRFVIVPPAPISPPETTTRVQNASDAG